MFLKHLIEVIEPKKNPDNIKNIIALLVSFFIGEFFFQFYMIIHYLIKYKTNMYFKNRYYKYMLKSCFYPN